MSFNVKQLLMSITCLASVLIFGRSNPSVAEDKPTIDFARDVYPLLQRSCWECHGSEKQEADLRLDRRDEALRSATVIVKGNSARSELVRRISLPKGHDEVMPSRGALLSKAEIQLIRAWIDAGAAWPDQIEAPRHWAYVAPKRHPLPQPVEGAKSVIDVWVEARLHRENLKMSPTADRALLLRRLSLDLIGLPPSIAEVDAFVNDRAPQAYERQVERLLASSQFGVRWARLWLDYARYADSHGFQRDDFRDLWPYRDWVVQALNADMPFTQFTIEQLAGDLLPNATMSQRIATGFNRSAPTNVEAGSDPEETRVNQIHDRINTLGMVWLGATLECAQCHNHKYDPFTQRDYYGLFAFFNNTSLEADRTNPKVPGSIQFKGPSLDLEDNNAARKKLNAELTQVRQSLEELAKNAAQGLDEWEASAKQQARDAAREHVLELTSFESRGGATHEVLSDQSVLLSGEPVPDKDTYVITAQTMLTGIRGVKLEALIDESLPGKGPGRGDAQRPNFVLNDFKVSTASTKTPDRFEPVRFARARASFSQSNFPVANLLQSHNGPKGGWAINPKFHESHWAILETDQPLGRDEGAIFKFELVQNFGSGRSIGRLRLSLLTGGSTNTALPDAVLTALAVAPAKRTEKQKQAIVDFRLKSDPKAVALESEKAQLEAQLNALKPATTLVMREDTPRMSSLFQRGDFRNPGDRVTPSTPSSLHPFNASQRTRLELAQWLVSRDNPLVARVVVNRWWSELFGHGLVTTPEDFGIKGERPTHPELLDWLACEFMDNGWSMKHVLKTIVMSATYQQSSRVTAEHLAQDDRNLWYARGPRHRLEAELIRDNALTIAGLLNPKLDGPPIKPYQPDGLWVKVGGQRYEYEVSPGDEKYRRGLFVVLKRGAPYPSFVSFDANNRMACRVSRPRSNTPLQALALMNDPVYVEAAMAFARRIIVEHPDGSDESRLRHGFRIALSREPQPQEINVLYDLLKTERAERRDQPHAAKFSKSFSIPKESSPAEFAAWYAIATTLLNLDETITKR